MISDNNPEGKTGIELSIQYDSGEIEVTITDWDQERRRSYREKISKMPVNKCMAQEKIHQLPIKIIWDEKTR